MSLYHLPVHTRVPEKKNWLQPSRCFLVLSGISIAIGIIGILAHQHVLDNVWKSMTDTSLPDLIKQIPDAIGGKDLVLGVGIVLIGAPPLIFLVKMAKSYRAERMSSNDGFYLGTAYRDNSDCKMQDMQGIDFEAGVYLGKTVEL